MPKLRILLDECVDRRLASHIAGHNVTTAPELGWAGLSNGELLDKAQPLFDVFLTTDRNLSYQQNLSRFDLMVIVLRARTNRLDDLLSLIPELHEVLQNLQTGSCQIIGS